MTDDDDILAAEFALGLLDVSEVAIVDARVAQDSAFAARVEWWRDQLTPLVDEAETPPSTSVWQRIERALPQNDNIRLSLQRWRATAISVMAVAASLAAVVLLRPAPVTLQPHVMLAALKGTEGTTTTVAYESTSGQLTILPGGVETKGHDAELWIIPADGTPRSLGVIDVNQPTHPLVAANRRSFIQSGSSFAISLEPKGGSPTGLPTGPVVSSGKLATT
jgi:anti-sigma-K factor RskA